MMNEYRSKLEAAIEANRERVLNKIVVDSVNGKVVVVNLVDRDNTVFTLLIAVSEKDGDEPLLGKVVRLVNDLGQADFELYERVFEGCSIGNILYQLAGFIW